jgi:DNA-binding transcriptional MerR regulator
MGVAAAAQYLDVTPRTIDRWERTLGLPVHRIGKGNSARKRYYRSELDEWVRNRYTADAADHPASGGGRRPDGLIG